MTNEDKCMLYWQLQQPEKAHYTTYFIYSNGKHTADFSFQSRGPQLRDPMPENLRREIKYSINIMCLNHPQTIPHLPPVCGKTVFHETCLWCQKVRDRWFKGIKANHLQYFVHTYWLNWTSQAVLVVENPPANAGDTRDVGSSRGSGRSPGGGQGNPLQYSCWENPMDRRAWRATVHRFAKSQTQLKWLSMNTKHKGLNLHCYLLLKTQHFSF